MATKQVTDYISEWYRCATYAPHPVTRRQIVEVPGGYQLTPIELVGKGPESLRDYDGGWHFASRTHTTLASAERLLTDNGYTREMPEAGEHPDLRKRSGTGGKAKAAQRAVRIPDEQWERLGELATKRGTDRNTIINELVAEYCGRIPANC